MIKWILYKNNNNITSFNILSRNATNELNFQETRRTKSSIIQFNTFIIFLLIIIKIYF